MGIVKTVIGSFFKSKKPFLDQLEQDELKNIQKRAYMDEARKICDQLGRQKAQAELLPRKKEVKDKW